ncbi:AMSH-like ubiquitin thioesterase 2 [Nymphaea thermarum]|nr:AMSH-like ubiquitin thioesterase 2 [Nymphaea thermarum]
MPERHGVGGVRLWERQRRSYGIFRLTEPTGTTVLRKCQETGFHVHEDPSDGSPLYEDCAHVYMNPNLRFEIVDIR